MSDSEKDDAAVLAALIPTGSFMRDLFGPLGWHRDHDMRRLDRCLQRLKRKGAAKYLGARRGWVKAGDAK